MKIQGFIGWLAPYRDPYVLNVIPARVIENSYGQALLFASVEDAKVAGAVRAQAVYKAKRPTKKEIERDQKQKKGEAILNGGEE